MSHLGWKELGNIQTQTANMGIETLLFWFSSKRTFWYLLVASRGLQVFVHLKKWGVCLLWTLCKTLPVTGLSLYYTVETAWPQNRSLTCLLSKPSDVYFPVCTLPTNDASKHRKTSLEYVTFGVRLLRCLRHSWQRWSPVRARSEVLGNLWLHPVLSGIFTPSPN